MPNTQFFTLVKKLVGDLLLSQTFLDDFLQTFLSAQLFLVLLQGVFLLQGIIIILSIK